MGKTPTVRRTLRAHTLTQTHTSPQRTKVNLGAPRAATRHLLPPPYSPPSGDRRRISHSSLTYTLVRVAVQASPSVCAPAKCVDAVNIVCAYIDGDVWLNDRQQAAVVSARGVTS